MKRILVLLVLVLVPSTAHADGCAPSDCGTATVTVAGSPVIAVRARGSSGPAQVFSLRSGRWVFDLPGGLPSANGRVHYSTRLAPGQTSVDRYDARTGRRTAAWDRDGSWWLNALSADGRYLAFAEIGHWKRKFTRLLVTTGNGRVVRELRLHGIFEVEALSRDARRLYLVQHLRRGYAVRGYDFETRRLSTLRAGTDPAVMNGLAWGAAASSDGRWFLTLYLENRDETAIHALDVANGTAACIALPGGSFEQARNYTIIPGRRVAYAANPVLGVVARVDLDRLRVTSVARFDPVRRLRMYGGTGAVGSRLYFGADRFVWTYDPSTLRITRTVVPRRVIGIGVVPGGKQVRVATFGGKMVTMEA